MAMPNNLVLVRHGRSEPNIIQGRIKAEPGYVPPDGFYDRHDSVMRLSPKGVQQAGVTGEWLDSEFIEGFDHYYVSSLLRTVETAGSLAIGGKWKVDDRWRERDWGEYGILNDEQRQKEYEISHRLKQQNKWYWCPPGGESLATGVRSRFKDILDTLHRETDGQDVIAITHGEMMDVARFVLERLTPLEWAKQDKDPKYKTSNCQILHYTRTDPLTGEIGGKLRWRRSVCAWDSSRSWDNGEWVEITHKIYTDDELLLLADSKKRLL